MAEVSGVQHKSRRGSSVQLGTFTGSSGELCADTTFQRLSVADGVTAGGWYSGKANTQQFLAGFLYSLSLTDAVEYVYTNSAITQMGLPLAARYASGQKITVADVNNNAGTDNIEILTNTSTETIVGYAGGSGNSTQLTIAANAIGYQLIALSTAGRWFLV